MSLGGCKSNIGSVQFGVPQGSVLSPLLFSMYIFPLGQFLRSLGLKFHSLEHCISEVKIWMSQNCLS